MIAYRHDGMETRRRSERESVVLKCIRGVSLGVSVTYERTEVRERCQEKLGRG